jgi:hypothetical protein
LTPRQFQALDKAWMRGEQRAYGRVGIVAAMVGNYSMMRPQDPFEHTDFIPGYRKKELSEDELAEQIEATLGLISVPVKAEQK